MGNYLTYRNSLRQYAPGLAPEQAEFFINQAWRDIRQASESWSFLFGTQYWLAPASISLTALEVTANSATVLLSHDAIEALAGLSNPALTVRQLRFSGPVYGISSSDIQQATDGAISAASTTLVCASGPFSAGDVGAKIRVAGAGASGADLDTTIAGYTDPTTVTLTAAAGTLVSGATVSWGTSLTLDRLYRGSTSATATAICLRLYYKPETTDWQRLDHLIDPITGYEWGWDILTADDLDRVDPQRMSQGQPYRIYFHGFDSSDGLPIYEMWPGPTVARAYPVYYWRLGTDFSANTDTLPPQISEELLLMRARLLVYEWAMVNDEDPRRRSSYANALGYVRSKYSTEGQPGRPLGLLETAKRRDKSVAPKGFIRQPRSGSVGWPIDANFAQSHAIPSWYG